MGPVGDNEQGGYCTSGQTRALVTLARLARELGADIIKADPADPPEEFHLVMEAARCPVLVRGGGKEDLDAVLLKAENLLRQGARGLVFCRNVYQHAEPVRVVRALKALVHGGVFASQAHRIYLDAGLAEK